MPKKVRILVVGLGNMGLSHAKAYDALPGFDIVGLCARHASGATHLPLALEHYPRFDDYASALRELAPDAVSINTWPATHAAYAQLAFEAGAHVFLEKPIAESVEEAEQVVASARRANRKLVIGYILRHHPAWQQFVDVARGLGKPLVMRMNLNQQSSGETWSVHKHLMNSISPIVDCGVHYVDMMCLMTESRPVSVHAIGARLSDEIAPDMYNYGQLQVRFEDTSVGWYEAGWGPMMSETAFFVKDVIGPRGCVSIVGVEGGADAAASDDVNAHTKTNALRVHHAQMTDDQVFARHDDIVTMADEPDHDALCLREQVFFHDAIVEDRNLERHMAEAVNSLAIVLAADRSIRTGQVVTLSD